MKIRFIIFFAILIFVTADLSAQDQPQKTGDQFPLKPKMFSFSAALEYQRFNFGFPDSLIFTPTHPNDVDVFRPPRSQAMPIPAGFLQSGSVGMTVRPLRAKYLYPLGLGVKKTFSFPGQNSFRDGGLMNRLLYQYFIGGEEAYTYARVSHLGSTQFNATYQFLGLPKDQPDKIFYLEIGAKRSFSKVDVTQGWDRYNRDEVWRVNNYRIRSWGGTLGIGFGDYKSFKMKIALEIERAQMNFSGLPARHFWILGIVYGIEISPFKF